MLGHWQHFVYVWWSASLASLKLILWLKAGQLDSCLFRIRKQHKPVISELDRTKLSTSGYEIRKVYRLWFWPAGDVSSALLSWTDGWGKGKSTVPMKRPLVAILSALLWRNLSYSRGLIRDSAYGGIDCQMTVPFLFLFQCGFWKSRIHSSCRTHPAKNRFKSFIFGVAAQLIRR